MSIVTAVLAVTVLSLVLTTASLIDALIDLRRVVIAKIGNGRLLYAKGQVRRETIRLATVGLFVWVAWTLLDMVVHPPSPPVTALLTVYLMAQTGIAINAIADLFLNHRVRSWYAAQRRERESQ